MVISAVVFETKVVFTYLKPLFALFFLISGRRKSLFFPRVRQLSASPERVLISNNVEHEADSEHPAPSSGPDADPRWALLTPTSPSRFGFAQITCVWGNLRRHLKCIGSSLQCWWRWLFVSCPLLRFQSVSEGNSSTLIPLKCRSA